MDSSPERLNSITQRLICTAIVLCLLYVGRDILIPTVVAVVLAFGLMPLVRRLQRLGLNRILSVSAVVLLTSVLLGNVVLNMGSELVRIAESLPQYENNIRYKFSALDDLTFGRLKVVLAKANGIVGGLGKADQPAPAGNGAGKRDASEVLTVRLEEKAQTPQMVIGEAIGSIVHFIEVAGLALVVLVFVLIDYEVLRDRLIRLIGGRKLRETTTALNEAGNKLMRYFATQIAVNALSGTVVGLSLHALGVPEATFWGALTAISRFVPYVGVWAAMAASLLMAAALDPGWSLVLATLAAFLIVELSVSQIIEPKFYGHTTGLSPLSVVIGAIFWAGLWGPVGLILATPLTLLLVVAGHYVPSLHFIELLLGEVPGLSAAERFYQRALAGDARELAIDLEQFLRKKSASEYCDHVLIPFMALAKEDFSLRAITELEIANLSRTTGKVLRLLERPARKKGGKAPHGNRVDGRPAEIAVIGGKGPVSDMYAKTVLAVLKSNGVTATLSPIPDAADALLDVSDETRAVIFAASDAGDRTRDEVADLQDRLGEHRTLSLYAFIPDLNDLRRQALPDDFPTLLSTYREIQSVCDALPG